jgi:hypothetical protein
MRSGAWGPALLLALLVAVAGSRLAAADAHADLTLETLMERMGATPGVVAEFTERKEVALLKAPLSVEGVLYFVPPDRMVRRTRRPSVSVLTLDGDRMRFRDEAGGDDFDLSASPEARQFVDGFIVLFNGDLDGLRERYRVDFEATGARWQLGLAPRRSPVRDFIASITLRGEGATLQEMVLVETDGDRTTTVFGASDVAHRFSREELHALFSTGALPPTGASASPARPDR